MYQKMLSMEQPYYISSAEKIGSFEKHRHPEIEFSYCLSGSYPVIVNDKTHTLKSGELLIIGSMVAHEFPVNDCETSRALVIEVGPMLLSEYFDILVRITANNPILKVDKENHQELHNLFK